MIGIEARNPHQALPVMCNMIGTTGVPRGSRNGPVLSVPGPVSTHFHQPTERVVFWPERDANPYFHLFEALWMLQGRNDVDFPVQFARNLAEYSDNGVTFNGAYGYRWRQHFGRDQLKIIAAALAADPQCRRQVLTMWDARHDLGLASKDLPCNTQIYVQRGPTGALDVMVCNRSNDMIWGALGANAVHMTVLQEYLAKMVGCAVGEFHSVSFNMHLYTDPHGELRAKLEDKLNDGDARMPYEEGIVNPIPLVSIPVNRWDRELGAFLANPDGEAEYVDPFIEGVAKPLWRSWKAFKRKGDPGRFQEARGQLGACGAPDWKLACWEWVARREKRAEG